MRWTEQQFLSQSGEFIFGLVEELGRQAREAERAARKPSR